MLKINDVKNVNMLKKLLKTKEIINVKSKPPRNPKIVLFGLMLGKIFFFPNNEPRIYEKVSKQIINRIKYKNTTCYCTGFCQNVSNPQVFKVETGVLQ